MLLKLELTRTVNLAVEIINRVIIAELTATHMALHLKLEPCLNYL